MIEYIFKKGFGLKFGLSITCMVDVYDGWIENGEKSYELISMYI